MISVRRAGERGHANLGWLDTWRAFSFADYYDSNFMGFRSLRVINEDRVAGGGGFPMHPHRDMEILTYILSGALLHRDSLGSKTIMKTGEIQRITAGAGVEHSEFNYSLTEPAHLLQIWVTPETTGLEPAYAQKSFVDAPVGRFTLAASRSGRESSISIHQDVDLYIGKFTDQTTDFKIQPGSALWLQATDSGLSVNDIPLVAGDGAAVIDEPAVVLAARGAAHFLMFDLK